MLLAIHSQTPQPRLVHRVVDTLRSGGIIIYPTDTVYGMGCDMTNKKAIERVCQLKGVNPKDFLYAIICPDLTNALEYAHQINNSTYKLLKRALPGPFTFILEAGRKLPHFTQSPRKSIGIRVIDNAIMQAVLEEFGGPIITTSLKHEDHLREYPTDPEEIYDRYGKQVDMVIDGGYGGNVPSTIVDLTNEAQPVLLREGLGDPNALDIEWEEA